MPSPLHGNRWPFPLQSNILYFHDWRYIHSGRECQWFGPDDQPVPRYGTDPLPPMHYEHPDLPLGIRLVAQKARKDGPVLTPQQTGDTMLCGGTLIHEDGRYRLWIECLNPASDTFNLLRYAESDDGMEWKMPSLGLVECRGSRDNNVVYGGPLTPQTGYHGGSVFKDPSAPPDERYKVFHLGHISQEELARYRQARPDEVDPRGPYRRRVGALMGGVSPDGLRWKPLPEPLLVQTSDTHNVCTYDAQTGKYVAYVRSWYFNRRTIGRTETDDFRRFPLPEELIWPNAAVEPYDSWYSNAKTMMPVSMDYHVMFPLRWRLIDDLFDFHLATSPDGIVWGFVPGGPVCETGDPGAWDGGGVAPQIGLADLPGDRIGLLINGWRVPHKHPRRPPLGELGWAWWPKGRLVALRAETEGSFCTWPLLFQGRTARLNIRTSMAGYVKVEAVWLDLERAKREVGEDWLDDTERAEVLPGRSFDDCDGISGDHLDHLVTWRGQADLGHPEGAAVALRFRLRCADLYSVSFK